MSTKKSLTGWVAAAVLAMGCLQVAGLKGVLAQPAAAQNGGGQNQQGRRNLTPEELRAMMEKALKGAGLTDEEVKIVFQFQNSRQEMQAPLRQEFQKLRQVTQNDQATDAEVQAALDSYRAARKTSESAVEEARKKLDDAVHYSTRLKVEATLLVWNILDSGVRGGRPGGGRPGGGGGGGG